jgi:hypothetical protein
LRCVSDVVGSAAVKAPGEASVRYRVKGNWKQTGNYRPSPAGQNCAHHCLSMAAA